MSGEIRGVDVLIYNSAGVAIAGQRDATLSIKADKIDTSTKTNNGFKTALAGLREWSVSMDCVNYDNETSEAAKAAQRTLRQAAIDGTTVSVVIAIGDEEVYLGTAAVTGLDITGPMTDVSMSSFTLDGASKLKYEYAPIYVSVAVSGANKIATITFSEDVKTNAADAAALKAAVTFAADGTTFAALSASDTVTITSGDMVVTFNSAFTGSANKLKIAADTVKSTNGAIQTVEQTTGAFAAA
jgi:predicted secreted protein